MFSIPENFPKSLEGVEREEEEWENKSEWEEEWRLRVARPGQAIMIHEVFSA